jgi:hypothetical protein
VMARLCGRNKSDDDPAGCYHPGELDRGSDAGAEVSSNGLLSAKAARNRRAGYAAVPSSHRVTSWPGRAVSGRLATAAC